jgi:hypothetical protein
VQVESEELFGRVFACNQCGSVVVLCQGCDHGNIYCSELCRRLARQKALRLAGARYQGTFTGAQKHANRQAAYRIRQEQKVTHHPFSADQSSAIVEQAEQEVTRTTEVQSEEPVMQQHCISCGRCCVFVVRRWLPLHRRVHQRQGEKYDSCQRGRGGNIAPISC